MNTKLAAGKQLDATLVVCREYGGKALPLTREEKHQVIEALINKYGGTQNQLRTIVFRPSESIEGLPPGVFVQLWIHDWE